MGILQAVPPNVEYKGGPSPSPSTLYHSEYVISQLGFAQGSDLLWEYLNCKCDNTWIKADAAELF